MNKLKLLLLAFLLYVGNDSLYAKNFAPLTNPPTDTTGMRIKLPPGFTAVVIARGMDGARHIAITKQGGVYVKLGRLKDGKGIYYLKDTNGDGVFDKQMGFGDYPGTGICIKNNYLYASSNEAVFRYKLNDKGEVVDPNNPEKIVTGLVNHNRDNSKSITIDGNNNLYVNVGSYSNSCLLEPKSTVAPMPCPLLDSVGGIWKFKTDKLNQSYKDGTRYATGFKNVVGIDWNTSTNSLFIMQHGRDQFHDLYPQFFSAEQNSTQPAETMYEVHQGSNGGWPYIYFDTKLHKKMMAPEYGGDGKKLGTVKAIDPVKDFPAHLAPDGLLFYTGKKFPTKYGKGAFIAFHNKSDELQKGYFLAFLPFKGNKPAGDWEVFADNFGAKEDFHKPCGLAQGPDGNIYVTDDARGCVYMITYSK